MSYQILRVMAAAFGAGVFCRFRVQHTSVRQVLHEQKYLEERAGANFGSGCEDLEPNL
jgi:hypothetical protein